MTPPVVGKSVDGWCARCKLMLAHTIEAVVKDKITRTHCNTCGAQHAHRPNQPGTKSAGRGASPARARASKAAQPEVDYQAVLRGTNVANARAYKTSERFQEKDVINHPAFG